MAALAIPAAEMGMALLPEMGAAIGAQAVKTGASMALTGATVGSAAYGTYKTGKRIHREVTGAYHDAQKISKVAVHAAGRVAHSNKHHVKTPAEL